ncbi:MAG: anti-sigma factor [Leptothrix sp. (in: b-proteobacteria)]
MNDPHDAIHPDTLHAFVDGELDPARLPALLAWLQTHPDDAARVRHWQAQRLQLRQLARQLDLGATPPGLTATVLRADRATQRRALWRQAAAVVLLVSAGVSAGVYGDHRWGQGAADLAANGVIPATAQAGRAVPAPADSPAFVRDAALAHAVFVPEQRHPVEVGAAEQAHLIQWLSRRLGAPLKAPSLAARGYALLGGHLLPGEGTPRAQFMYENASGARLTLYVAVFEPGQAPAPTSFRLARHGSEQSFYWIEDRFGYALSAELTTPDLLALAREVQGEIGG